MPRLLGKSSKAPLYIGTALVVLVVGAVAIEYLGVIDMIPDFGKERKATDQLKSSNSHVFNGLDSNS